MQNKQSKLKEENCKHENITIAWGWTKCTDCKELLYCAVDPNLINESVSFDSVVINKYEK